MITLYALIAAAGLAMVHIFAGKLKHLSGPPRSRWLSVAGGVSVSYVFLLILPELSYGQEAIETLDHALIAYLERHIYVIALIGLAFYYGMERAATVSGQREPEVPADRAASRRVFWPHVTAFALYNALIGYLLFHRGDPEMASIILFAIAMAMHMSANDYALREHHQEAYAHVGRWVLAGAVLLGWGVGSLLVVGEIATTAILAFLAGGIILNILKEELPERRDSRFIFFASGAAIYSLLLLAI